MREFDPTFGVPSPEPLEQRQEQGSYADAVVTALLTQASGNSTFSALALGAAEICAGQWGRGFASALVDGGGLAGSAVTPAVLELIGRSLIRRGEQVFEIRVRGGRVQLEAAAWWEVHGDNDPDTWTYRLTFNGPDRQADRIVPGDAVVHVRYAVDAAEPWRGLSPLAVQPETAGLAAMLEKRLRQEVTGQVGNLIALPSTANTESFKRNLGQLGGRVLLVPTTTSGWEAGPDNRPRYDWRPERLGASPPDSLVQLRDRTAHHVLAACGVPTELIERADGTGLREAWRQFLFGTLAPVGRLVQAELVDKLDAAGLHLDWQELRASDLTGRARAFQSMVGGGMKPAKAASLAGLMEPE